MSDGLGDKIEKVIKVVGGDKVAEAVQRITKKPCNCQKRKEKLNRWSEQRTAQKEKTKSPEEIRQEEIEANAARVRQNKQQALGRAVRKKNDE